MNDVPVNIRWEDSSNDWCFKKGYAGQHHVFDIVMGTQKKGYILHTYLPILEEPMRDHSTVDGAQKIAEYAFKCWYRELHA